MRKKRKSCQAFLFLFAAGVFMLGMPYSAFSAPPGIDLFWEASGVITWTTNAANPFTGLVHNVRIIDHEEEIANDGSSHTVTVTYPNSGPTRTLHFQRRKDAHSAFYDYYDGGIAQPIDPIAYSGNYVFRVTRLSGEEEWSEATDELNIDPLDPPDETTFSPGLPEPQSVTAFFSDVMVNGSLYDDLAGDFQPDKWQFQPSEVLYTGGEARFQKTWTTGSGSIWMRMVDPQGANSVQTTVRVSDFSGSSPYTRVRIGGYFCSIPQGDVFAYVALRGNEAIYSVLAEGMEGNHFIGVPLVPMTTLGAVTLGNKYQLSIEWDTVSEFTFRVVGLDDSVNDSAVYSLSETVSPAIAPYRGIGISAFSFIDTTTPTFLWDEVPESTYYRVRVYGVNDSTIYVGYASSSPFVLPPGVLKPNALYKYRIEALRDHQWFEWDNVAVSDRNKTFFAIGTSEEAQDPHIDLWSIGVETWNLESAEPLTSFYLKVHDAQGVPGNIESVKVTFPDGLTQMDLYPDYNESPTCAIYRGNRFGVPQAGNYVFTVVDRDGNAASAEEELTPNPIGYPSVASITPSHNAVIGGTGVTFSWEEVPGAAFYQVNIYDKEMKRLFNFKTTGTSYVLPPGILQEDTLYQYNIHTRREFFEANTDNGSESPRTPLQNGFFTTSKSGDENNKPSIALGGYGATVFHAPDPVTGEPTFNLELMVKVEDADGVPENIAFVEVTYPLGQKRLLHYSDAPSWGFNYFYDEWHSDPSSIQSGTYTFRVVDFEGNEATIEDTLSDVSTTVLPWPTGALPSNESILNNLTPTIQWDPVEGASYYKVRVLKSWGAATIHWSPELTETSYTVPQGILSDNSWHAYRVYAYREPVGEEVDFYSAHSWWHGANPRFFTGQPGPSGWISGEVTTGVTGQTTAIVGATVTVVELGLTSTSGSDGAFLFTSIPVGTYTLKIEKDGFDTILLPGIQVVDGQTTAAPASEMTIAQVAPGLPGDANDDGLLGLDDVIYILQVLSGAR